MKTGVADMGIMLTDDMVTIDCRAYGMVFNRFPVRLTAYGCGDMVLLGKISLQKFQPTGYGNS
jgi:hypothetical protein